MKDSAQIDLDQIKEETFSVSNSMIRHPENTEGSKANNESKTEQNSARIGASGNIKSILSQQSASRELS